MQAIGGSEWLRGLPARLEVAVGAAELVAATEPPPGAAIVRRLEPDEIRLGDRLLPSPLPRVVLDLDPSVEATELCEAWGLERPVAVSGDVGQRRWEVLVGGDELPQACGRRISTEEFTAGRWRLRPLLTGRPKAPLPDTVAGASPAYDIAACACFVRRIEVAAAAWRSALVEAGHADARTLLEAMAARHPVWHTGWSPADTAELVVVYQHEQPVAGGVLGQHELETAVVSMLCLPVGETAEYAGSWLLDTLEAVAAGRGAERVRLDESVFLHAGAVPWERCGYTVGPPYDGDADVPVWVERSLRWPDPGPPFLPETLAT